MSELKTKLVVEKIFKQAENGIVRIGDAQRGYWTFFANFFNNIDNNTTAKNSAVPTIKITNYPLFLETVNNYLSVAKKFYSRDQDYFDYSDESFPEKLFLDLMINCTPKDTDNIIPYINTRTEMLKTPIATGRFDMGNLGDLSFMGIVTKRFSNLEGPYRFIPVFKDAEGKNEFTLPTITFGVANGEVQILAVQNEHTNQINPLAKKLDRYFRKVNKDVDPEDIISNISPNALVSLTLFTEHMKQNGLTNFTAPTFMPIRYYANKKAKCIRAKSDEERKQYLFEHDRNQYNITNKVMHLMLRYGHHFSDSEVCFDEVSEQMRMHINPQTTKTDNIIYDIANVVKYAKEQPVLGNEKNR